MPLRAFIYKASQSIEKGLVKITCKITLIFNKFKVVCNRYFNEDAF